MSVTKAGGGRHHKVHIYADRKPLCGSTRSKTGWQETMLLEPNCKSCIRKRDAQKRDAQKVGCKECSWRGASGDLLLAKSPFQKGDTLVGCPSCKCVNCFESLCDEPGCFEPVSCGTPTPTGYRSTCGKHTPK